VRGLGKLHECCPSALALFPLWPSETLLPFTTICAMMLPRVLIRMDGESEELLAREADMGPFPWQPLVLNLGLSDESPLLWLPKTTDWAMLVSPSPPPPHTHTFRALNYYHSSYLSLVQAEKEEVLSHLGASKERGSQAEAAGTQGALQSHGKGGRLCTAGG